MKLFCRQISFIVPKKKYSSCLSLDFQPLCCSPLVFPTSWWLRHLTLKSVEPSKTSVLQISTVLTFLIIWWVRHCLSFHADIQPVFFYLRESVKISDPSYQSLLCFNSKRSSMLPASTLLSLHLSTMKPFRYLRILRINAILITWR